MFAFGMPGGTEMVILLVLGLLIFGRRLPEVGRNLGRSIVEFKRGVKNITDDIDEESDYAPKSVERLESQSKHEPYKQTATEPGSTEQAINKPQSSG